MQKNREKCTPVAAALVAVMRLVLTCLAILCSNFLSFGQNPNSKMMPKPSKTATISPVAKAAARVNPAASLWADYDKKQWLEIIGLDSTVVIDLRYATKNNFVRSQMYDCPRCFLRPEAARAIVKAHQALKKRDLAA